MPILLIRLIRRQRGVLFVIDGNGETALNLALWAHGRDYQLTDFNFPPDFFSAVFINSHVRQPSV